jgi:hypothetical protein
MTSFRACQTGRPIVDVTGWREGGSRSERADEAKGTGNASGHSSETRKRTFSSLQNLIISIRIRLSGELIDPLVVVHLVYLDFPLHVPSVRLHAGQVFYPRILHESDVSDMYDTRRLDDRVPKDVGGEEVWRVEDRIGKALHERRKRKETITKIS